MRGVPGGLILSRFLFGVRKERVQEEISRSRLEFPWEREERERGEGRGGRGERGDKVIDKLSK